MSGSNQIEDGENEVWRITRDTVGGSGHTCTVEDMGMECSAVDVGQCLKLTATHIVNESERSDPQQAEKLLMWQALLDEEGLDSLPLSCGKCILAYAWATLVDLRCENHRKGRCICGQAMSSSEMPRCPHTFPQLPDDGLPPNPSYNPQMDAEDMRQKTSEVVDAGSNDYERPFPAAPDVAAQEISDCIWKAIRRLLAESYQEDEEQKETYEIWKAIFDQGIETIDNLSPGVLICLLFPALDDVVGMRGRNHDAGRCSHEGDRARPDRDTPFCKF